MPFFVLMTILSFLNLFSSFPIRLFVVLYYLCIPLESNIRKDVKRLFLLLFLLVGVAVQIAYAGNGQRVVAHRVQRAQSLGVGSTDVAALSAQGSPRIPVILVGYKDLSFVGSNSSATWTKQFNDETGTSVRKYFSDQSFGSFTPRFDVFGPYTLSRERAYYGANDDDGSDLRPDEMVREACTLAAVDVDYDLYDNDGDGSTDIVLIVYAGEGEAVSENADAENYIWPGVGKLADGNGGRALNVNGTNINTYIVLNELSSYYPTKEEGIGPTCHELGHCLGLPDWYDTQGGNHYGMGSWSVMDFGCYGNAAYTPCNYTAYERAFMGWMKIEELTDSGEYSLQPVSSGGKAYRISSENDNEYYILENRQLEGWDKYLPSSGLMVTHVNYDKERWLSNTPNNYADKGMSIIPADNSLAMKQSGSVYSCNLDDEPGDLFPYAGCDSLTDNGTPAALLYAGNGRMGKPLTYITQHSDGAVSFVFSPHNVTSKGGGQGEILFYESFNKCSGTGGNDGKWSGNIASSKFLPDVDKWHSDGIYKFRGFGASQCARFGTTTVLPMFYSPTFTVSGVDTLTFMAAAWGDETTTLIVTAGNDNAVVSPTSFDLPNGSWKTFRATITGNGETCLRFNMERAGRFFLDEVKVYAPVTAGLNHTAESSVAPCRTGIYTLDGRRLTIDERLLPCGVYIINGRKVVK